MITRFKKNLYQWSPLAVILIIMLGCVSLPDVEHKEAVVSSAAKPSPATKVNGPAYRLVLDDQIAGMPMEGYTRHFSPSGDRIVFRSQGKLYIADQTGTVIRPILDDPGPWKMRGGDWSPDGWLIAYVGTREVASESGTHNVSAIFVVSPDGGGPRQIGPEVRGAWSVYRGLKWTPDGRHLSYSDPGAGGLHTLTLDGDEVRFIPNKDMANEGARLPYGGCYSPDGRWFVYSRTKDNATHEYDMDLYIIPTSGGTPRRLTYLPEFNGHVTWAPDSSDLYFVSGQPTSRPGTRNIWTLPMDPETGLARGEPQQVTFFKDVYIAASKVLGDGSRIGFTMWRQNTSIQVADASSPHESSTLVRGHSPQLSPDGQTIYYLDNKPGEEGIYVVPRQGGTPRRLTKMVPGDGNRSCFPRFDVCPDGQILAYSAKLGEGKGLFTLSVSGGKPQLVAKLNSGEVIPQWSPDGSSLAYADGNDLYVVPVSGGEPRVLAHMNRGWDEWTIRWSPGGKLIAALGYPIPKSKNENNAVLVVRASDGRLRQLTPAVDWKDGLTWHPDGQRLTYHVDMHESETRQAYLDGRPPTLLVNAPDTWDYVGIWAPDGHHYFFVSWAREGDGGGSGIFIYDEASGETKLCVDVSDAGVPCWSRDGKTMAWSQTRLTIRQTWIMENFLPKSTASR